MMQAFFKWPLMGVKRCFFVHTYYIYDAHLFSTSTIYDIKLYLIYHPFVRIFLFVLRSL